MSRVGEAGFPAGNSLYPTSAGTAPTKPVGENQGGDTGFVEYKSNPLTRGIGVLAGDVNLTPSVFVFGQRRKVILIGDSITRQNWANATFDDATGENYTTSPEGYDTSCMGYATMCNALMGNPFTFVNAAKDGQQTAWMLTNLALILGRHADADEVWIHGGVNDAANSVAAETTSANIIAMVDTALAAGKRVVWSTTVAPSNAGVVLNATKLKQLVKANALTSKALRSYTNVDVVDSSGTLLDTALTTGHSSTSYMYDELHPSNYGAFLWAIKLRDTIAYRQPPIWGGIDSSIYTYASDATNPQLLADPLNLGATGASAGTGVTGTQVSSLIISRDVGTTSTAVASVVASPDGIGKSQRIVVSASDAGGGRFRVLDAASSAVPVVAGGRYVAEFFVKCSNISAFQSAMLELSASVTASVASPAVQGLGAVAAVDAITYSGDLVLRVITPELIIPADTSAVSNMRATLYLSFVGTGGGTFDIYRRALYRVG